MFASTGRPGWSGLPTRNCPSKQVQSLSPRTPRYSARPFFVILQNLKIHKRQSRPVGGYLQNHRTRTFKSRGHGLFKNISPVRFCSLEVYREKEAALRFSRYPPPGLYILGFFAICHRLRLLKNAQSQVELREIPLAGTPLSVCCQWSFVGCVLKSNEQQTTDHSPDERNPANRAIDGQFSAAFRVCI